MLKFRPTTVAWYLTPPGYYACDNYWVVKSLDHMATTSMQPAGLKRRSMPRACFLLLTGQNRPKSWSGNYVHAAGRVIHVLHTTRQPHQYHSQGRGPDGAVEMRLRLQHPHQGPSRGSFHMGRCFVWQRLQQSIRETGALTTASSTRAYSHKISD